MKYLLTILSLFILLGCGSKKKVTESEKVKKETTEVVEKKEKETKVIKTDSVAEKKETVVTRTKDQEIDIVADSTGTVTREIEKTDTGYKETFTGVKTVYVRDKTIDKEKATELRVSKSKTDSLNKLLDEVRQSKVKEVVKTEYKEKEEKFGLFWFWAFIVTLILLILSNRKRISQLIRGSPV